MIAIKIISGIQRWQLAADESRNCESNGEMNRYWIPGREEEKQKERRDKSTESEK